MTEHMKSPYENYRPPGLAELFSTEADIEIVTLKLTVYSHEVVESLLEGDQREEMDDFIKGYQSDLWFEYNCRRLDPYMPVPHSEFELACVASAVNAAIYTALLKKEVMEDVNITYSKGYAKDSPRLAHIGIFKPGA